MIVVKTSSSSSKNTYSKEEWYDRALDSDIGNIVNCLNSRVRFGVGTSGKDGENISGQFVQFTSSATPDAENTVVHTIGSIPVGYIIMYQTKAGSLYQGPTTGTAWSSSAVYLKCSIASVTFLLFLVK